MNNKKNYKIIKIFFFILIFLKIKYYVILLNKILNKYYIIK